MDAIVAVYADWGIGSGGTQPVVLKADRTHFRELTRGAAVGRLVPGATGRLYVLTAEAIHADSSEADKVFENELGLSSPDNRILRVACALRNAGRDVVFISKDINLRLKADALGLQVMDFETEKVRAPELYRGFCRHMLSAAELDRLYRERELPGAVVPDALANEFIVFVSEADEKKTALARRRTDLRRFDVFTQGQWWFFGRTDEGYPAKRDRKYEWFPLPESAITVNPGLVQNPNYVADPGQEQN